MTPLDLANSEIAELRQKIETLTMELDEARRTAENKIDVAFNGFVSKRYGLTDCETRILLALWYAHGMTMSKDYLNQSLPGYYQDREKVDLKVVDVFVCKVRKKIKTELDVACIETVWCRGFRMLESFSELIDVLWIQYKTIAKISMPQIAAE